MAAAERRKTARLHPELGTEPFEGVDKATLAKAWTTSELPALGKDDEADDVEAAEEERRREGRRDFRAKTIGSRDKLTDHQDAPMQLLHFRRATTSPAVMSALATTPGSCRSLGSRFDPDDYEDSDGDLLDLPPRRRAVTEPARPQRRPSYLLALFNVDTALPFVRKGVSVLPRKAPLVNLLLCLVSLAAGCIFPVLVDLSKTATAIGPNGEQVKRLPYSPDSVLRTEASFNVLIGLVAILITRQSRDGYGFKELWKWELHRRMLPLTLVYCLGDIAALCAIDSGGGPLYIAISNSRLLFAAGASHCYLGRHQTRGQWFCLAEIVVATAFFAALSAGGRKSESQADAGATRAAIGICWAVAKAFLSGLAAVLTESQYKKIDLWHANTLLKGQSLAVAFIGGLLHARWGVEELPLCDSEAAMSATFNSWCVDRKGWDSRSWAVLFAEISTGWLSVAVLTRMSAIAKFVCKTATAPTLYLFYSWKRLGGFRFEIRSFAAVTMIAVGILAYTAVPYWSSLRPRASSWAPSLCPNTFAWVRSYASLQRSPAGS